MKVLAFFAITIGALSILPVLLVVYMVLSEAWRRSLRSRCRRLAAQMPTRRRWEGTLVSSTLRQPLRASHPGWEEEAGDQHRLAVASFNSIRQESESAFSMVYTPDRFEYVLERRAGAARRTVPDEGGFAHHPARLRDQQGYIYNTHFKLWLN